MRKDPASLRSEASRYRTLADELGGNAFRESMNELANALDRLAGQIDSPALGRKAASRDALMLGLSADSDTDPS